MGEEGMQPHHYDRQVENSEAFREKVERLEKQGAFQHRIEPKPMSKTKEFLIGVLAILLVAGLLIAAAAVCFYPLS